MLFVFILESLTELEPKASESWNGLEREWFARGRS